MIYLLFLWENSSIQWRQTGAPHRLKTHTDLCWNVLQCGAALLMRDLTPAPLGTICTQTPAACVSDRGVVCLCCACPSFSVTRSLSLFVSARLIDTPAISQLQLVPIKQPLRVCSSAAAVAAFSSDSNWDVWVESPPGSPAAPRGVSKHGQNRGVVPGPFGWLRVNSPDWVRHLRRCVQGEWEHFARVFIAAVTE